MSGETYEPSNIYADAARRLDRLGKGESYFDVYGAQQTGGRLKRIDLAVVRYADWKNGGFPEAMPPDDREDYFRSDDDTSSFEAEIQEPRKRKALYECDKEVKEMYWKELRDIAKLVSKHTKVNNQIPVRSGDAYDLVKEMIKSWESNTDQESQRTLQAELTL